jgi:hypothetical protein
MRLTVVCVLSLVAAVPALADPISFEINGTLTGVYPNGGPSFTPTITAGTNFTATITYDPSYYGTYGCGSNYCQYTPTSYSFTPLFSVQIGSDIIASNGIYNSIGVAIEPPALGGDGLHITAFSTSNFGIPLPADFGFDTSSPSVSYSLDLYDSTGTVFPDVSLPSSVNQSGFDSGYLQIQIGSGGADQLILDGSISTASNSSVPEPGTLLLTTAGLLAAGIAYRRKRLTV